MGRNRGKNANAHPNNQKKREESMNAGRIGDQSMPPSAHVPSAARPTTVPPPATSTIGMQTMQQRRAAFALKTVKEALTHENGDKTKQEAFNKAYKSNAASFPAMIQMNGLGQAAAFYFSQGGASRTLYESLSAWLTGKDQPYAGKTDLLAGITTRDMHVYRVAQAEALALLDWVKKFAKAYMRED